MLTLEYTSRLPSRGNLVALSGDSLAVVLDLEENKNVVKVVAVRKNGKREICYYLIEGLGGPDPKRLASLIGFYDRRRLL